MSLITPKNFPSFYRQTTVSNYLLDSKDIGVGEVVYLNDSNRTFIKKEDMQAALDYQYGKKNFRVESHGSARYIRNLSYKQI